VTPPTAHAADRLLEAIDRAGAPACVGIDPVLDRLPASVLSAEPADAIERFATGVLDAVQGVAAAVKPQSACFERFGAPGLAALERTISRARDLGLFVILDAKRGDIGLTAAHYAAFAYDAMNADALTASPYLGLDTLEPLLRDGKLLFPLVRTSNPGSDEIQSLTVAEGETLAERVASGVARLGASRLGSRGYSDVGAVVAATKPDAAAALRARMPQQIFLVPGFGAQGGTIDSIRPLFQDGAGAIINASRSVIYPDDPGDDWQASIHNAAQAFAQQTKDASTPD